MAAAEHRAADLHEVGDGVVAIADELRRLVCNQSYGFKVELCV